MTRRAPPKSPAASTAPPTRRPRAIADQWRHDNIGRLLNNAIARFEARVLELMAQAGEADARLSHLSLTRNLDRSGTRVSDLAARAGMTKQAMGELVAQCVALGLVASAVDPSDKRARIIRFTSRGLQWLQAFRRAVDKAEQEMRKETGAAGMDALRKALKLYGGRFDSLTN